MVNERSDRVGCAIARYTDAMGVSGTLLACNYAVTNVQNNPIYRAGPPASECLRGRNPNYTNLCSTDEVYSYNTWAGWWLRNSAANLAIFPLDSTIVLPAGIIAVL